MSLKLHQPVKSYDKYKPSCPMPNNCEERVDRTMTNQDLIERFY